MVTIEASATSTDVAGCSGDPSGSIEITATGGQPPYDIVWFFDQQSGTIASDGGTLTRTDLVAEEYEIGITDANGCFTLISSIINQPSGVVADDPVTTDATCTGVDDGTASVSASGGSGTLEYALDGGDYQTSSSFTNISPGDHTITIRDASLCTVDVDFTIGVGADITAISSVQDADCNGESNGSITITPAGGALPYSYSLNGGTAQSSSVFSDLAAGTYEVTVQDDNGCSVVVSTIVVNEPEVLTATVEVVSDATCLEPTGELNALPVGGTPPYSYVWDGNNGLTNQNLTNAAAGPHTVVITDANGCTTSASASITAFNPISLELDSSVDEACDQANGSITVTVVDGTAPFSFTWSNGAPDSPTATGLAAGTYTVDVIDANGCEDQLLVTIDEIDPPSLVIDDTQNSLCTDGNGSITVEAIGGTAPFEYSIDGGALQASPTFDDLDAGTYTFTVVDALACEATVSGSIDLELPPSVTLNTLDAACGQDDGEIQAVVSGGNPGYSYAWSGSGQTGAEITGLAPGSYTVTVTDQNGCEVIESATIGEIAPPTITVESTSDATCGDSNGEATVSASGGTPPYDYAWSVPNPNTASVSNLPEGTHFVTVTDDRGCQTIEEIVINNIPGPASLGFDVTNSICAQGNGSITVSVNGGTAPFDYNWSNNNPNSATASGLSSGTYSVTVTDANGCTIVDQATVDFIESPTIAVEDTQNSLCEDGNGSITVTASGGTPPYNYNWSDGIGAAGATVSNLDVGTYSITVTDANNCTDVTSATINLEPAPIGFVDTFDDSDCGADNGFIEIAIVGGTGTAPISYSWSHNGSLDDNEATGLAPGTYTVTITDANGCEDVVEQTIDERPGPSLSLGSTTSDICGQSIGAATVVPSGGVSPYTYGWSDNPGVNSPTLSGVLSGTYTVTITDFYGCFSSLEVTIDEIPGPTLVLDGIDDLPCVQGEVRIRISVDEGTAPFEYEWDHDATLDLPIASDLSAGTYTVTVTDANDCSDILEVVVEDVGPPSLERGTIVDSDCGANNGSITVIPSGGTPPYEFRYGQFAVSNEPTLTGVPPGTYSIQITDANGCTANVGATVDEVGGAEIELVEVNGSGCENDNGSITVQGVGGVEPYDWAWDHDANLDGPVATGLSGGDYTVTLTDNFGCERSLTITVEETPPFIANISNVEPSLCEDGNGSLSISASGGATPYSIDWNLLPNGAGFNVSNLAAGNYEATVTDANGCEVILSQAVQLIEGPSVEISQQGDPGCFGPDGFIDLLITGGAEPYDIDWSHDSGVVADFAGNLPADDYSITVTDANGCETIIETTLTAPIDITLEITGQSPENCDLEDGSATVSVVGQTGDFNYNWSHDPGLDGPTASGLAADSYTVTVTGDGFCEAVQTVEILAVAGPSLSSPNTTDSDCNASNGSISFTVSGGTEPYTYAWDHDSNLDGPMADNLSAGTFTLIVTDANGCTVEGTATISNLEAPTAIFDEVIDPTCLNNDGSLSVQVSGGVQPYTYAWSHDGNEDGATVTGLGADTYSLTVTDVNGCQSIISETLEDDNPLLLELVDKTNSFCEDGNGSISVAASGGSGGYTISWAHDNGLTSSTITALNAGDYTATVTDENGCSTSLNIAIELVGAPILSVEDQTEAECIDNGSITLGVTGGIEPYSYNWSHNDQLNSNTATGLAIGSYSATVTDGNGCSATTTVEVEGELGPALTANSTNPACTNDNGSIAIQATGDDGPFLYAWSHDANIFVNEANGLAAGEYTVTVTSARGCPSTITLELVFEEGVSAFISDQSDSECIDGNGSITINASGGVAPYTVAWSHDDNAVGLSLDNLAAGDYSATVTDVNGCEDIVSTSIALQEGPTIMWTTEAGASCDDNNGALSASVSGGLPPYTYAWSHDTAIDGPIALGLAPGDYTLSVTDQNGCTTTLSSTIQVGELGLSITSSTDPSCSVSTDGSITAVGTGGVTPYTYEWSNGVTGETITGLGAGTYTVTMTDASGCESSVETTLIAANDLELTFSVLQNVCEGGNNGEVQVSASGGTGNYAYSWDAPGTPTTATISSLAPGEYVVTVTDDSGCGTSGTVTIEEVPGITLSLSSTPSCLDALNGTASVVATGGTGSFSYLWDDPNGQTTATASNLLPGVYTVVVSDDNGCTSSNSISVSASPALSLEMSSVTQPDCTTNPSGSVTVLASGGTGAISYQWDDANGQTTATAAGLDPGTYEVIATDENGCTASISIEIVAPGDLEVSVGNITPPSCAGEASGSAGVFVSNGSGDYTFLWNDPAGQTTASLNNVSAGTYQVRVTDIANGCFVVQTVTITAPDEISISLSSATPPPCGQSTGGEALVEASGGAGNYSYSWNDPNGQSSAFVNNLAPGNYEVVVMDQNGCTATLAVTIPEGQELSANISDFSGPSCADLNDGFATVSVVGGSANLSYQWNDPAFQQTATATGLSPGTYTVEITDDGDCSTSVTVEIPSTPALAVSLSSSIQPSCSGFNDGELSISISGGTGDYTILWDDASAQTTATASSLISGVYNVTITDGNGCDLTETFVLEDAAALTLSLETVEATCFSGAADGSITATIEGGTGPYTYQWDDAAAQTTATASNLAVGTYTIVVTDANGCNVSQSVDLGSSASEILVTEGQNSPSCEGGTDGNITIQVAGGAGGYTYAWSTGATTASLDDLSAGNYSLSITDAQGCTAERDFELMDGPVFTVDLGNVDTTICEGEVLFFDFSDLDYDVQWTGPNGFSSSDKIVLLEEAGEYTVAVTNAGGCSDEATINLSFGSDLFQALFLAPTDVVVDQEVVVVEVSWPAPDMVEWVYEPDSVDFNGSNQNQYFFSFPFPGEVDLTMIASAGGCEGILTKTLIVHPDSSSIPSAFQGQQEIIQFSLSPNPNMGDFNTVVELSEAKPVVLSVFGLDGVEVDRRILSGQSVYNESYNLSVTPGVYIMVLQTPTQRKSIVFSILSP
ncbi:MAG: T9SS type A sorting domain-containing protein [Saprospiraceae bacterium]|nr:T9SS type A sorting domain-containing protein [Saprospiraceae bacterium]